MQQSCGGVCSRAVNTSHSGPGPWALGPVPRKMVKFNPGLSQISSKVFSSKNMQLEVTIYCLVFTTRYSNNNTKCYPKQCIGM